MRRRNTRSDAGLCAVLGSVLAIVILGSSTARASGISYDQTTYVVHTTTDELFLGRDGNGTPVPDGSGLYEGQLKSNPNFGITWTVGQPAAATDVWEGSVVAKPSTLITSVYVQPVWDGYLERYHSLNGALTFEIFSDAGYSNLLHSDVHPIGVVTNGPWNINLSNVHYLGDQFVSANGFNRLYLRFTQEVSGGFHPDFGSGLESQAHTSYFELTALTRDRPQTPVPEPNISAMLALGLGLTAWVARRRK